MLRSSTFAPATAQSAEPSIADVERGRGSSSEAGPDEQDISKQLGSIEEDSVTTPKKRQETEDSEMTDPSPTNPPPKTLQPIIADVARGTKGGSDEAGLDEQ
jgi:hypothetical protein